MTKLFKWLGAVASMTLLVVIIANILSPSASSVDSAVVCNLVPLGESSNMVVSCTKDGVAINPSDIELVQQADGTIKVVVEQVVQQTIVRPRPTKTVHTKPRIVVKKKVVRVPQPRETQTIYLTPSPRYIHVPGPTRTVPGPERVETEFVTVTPAPSPSRQVSRPHGKIDVQDKHVFLKIDLGDGKLSPVEAGIGILTLLGLVGLLLLTLYAGYILGYKDKERKDTNFMRALLDAAAIRRGIHS